MPGSIRTTAPEPGVTQDESTSSRPEIRAASSGRASTLLQALSAEHWSLLSTRSLIYSESLSRVQIFIALLAGAVVGLALLAQVDGYHDIFTVAAILVFSVVLFVGLTTVARLSILNRDEFLTVAGMNRLRRGYVELHPELGPYFLSATHDDLIGVMHTMNMDMGPGRWGVRDALHGLQTLPATLGVIDAVVAGVLAALIAVACSASTSIAVLAGSIAFVVAVTTISLWTRKSFDDFATSLSSRFPTP